MKAITYSEAQKNLRAVIQDVCKNSEPTIIVGGKDEAQAVLVSLDDYQNMEETAYLLRSPANRAHLVESLKKVREGKLVNFPISCRYHY